MTGTQTKTAASNQPNAIDCAVLSPKAKCSTDGSSTSAIAVSSVTIVMPRLDRHQDAIPV